MKNLKNLLGTLCLLLASQGTQAVEKEKSVRLEVKDLKNDTYQIETYLYTQASDTLLWKIITDYEKTPDFVKSVKLSQVKNRKDNNVLLEMKCEGEWLSFIKLRLLLDMQENAQTKKITFDDVSNDKFFIFTGYWQVTKEGNKNVIHLSLKARPKETYWGMTQWIIEYSLNALFADIEKRAAQLVTEEATIKAPKP